VPFFGMIPARDVEDGEVRRRERAERLERRYGRDIDPRARAVGMWVIGLVFVAVCIAVAWGWMNLPPVR
jgi:hypothetical protein